MKAFYIKYWLNSVIYLFIYLAIVNLHEEWKHMYIGDGHHSFIFDIINQQHSTSKANGRLNKDAAKVLISLAC